MTYPAEDLRAVADAYIAHSSNQRAAAKHLGLSKDSFRRRLMAASSHGLFGFDSPLPLPGFRATSVAVTQDGDGRTRSVSVRTRPDDESERFTGLNQFEILKGRTIHVGPDGTIKQQWLKPSRDPLSPEVLMDTFREFFSDYRGHLPPTQLSPDVVVEKDWLTVYPIADWHIGLLAWGRENGGVKWDMRIARKAILGAMEQAIACTVPAREALIVSTGDLMHFSSYEPKTSRSGHILDADGRYPKVLRTTVEMMCDTIRLALTRHELVRVRILQGNHDDEPSVAVQMLLEATFANDPRVIVETDVDRAWAFRRGKVLLGFNHGDMRKKKDQPLVLAHDYPQDWARSELRVVYTGHLHHESLLEEGGVIVKQLRAPVARDAYHHFSKYRSGRSVYSDSYNIRNTRRLSVAIPL